MKTTLLFVIAWTHMVQQSDEQQEAEKLIGIQEQKSIDKKLRDV